MTNAKGGASLAAQAATLAPGLVLAVAVAAASVLIEAVLAPLGVKLPAIVIGLILGMALHAPASRRVFEPGLTFSVKKLLRWAIALLGLRVALADIVALGAATAAIVVASMALTTWTGLVFARWFSRSDAYGALAGGATAVCGASAALAISTVLPATKEREADTVFVVLAVNALSTVAMIAYPFLATALGFSDRATGVLLGATIHDVAQVVGAGYAVSEPVGNIAVIVKLFRVFLLLPVVLGLGLAFAGQGGGTAEAKVPIPVFALVFLALAAANSLGLVPAAPRAILLEASRWGLLIAIAALGLKTSVGAMVALGWRHMAVVSVSTIFLLVIVALPLALLKL